MVITDPAAGVSGAGTETEAGATGGNETGTGETLGSFRRAIRR